MFCCPLSAGSCQFVGRHDALAVQPLLATGGVAVQWHSYVGRLLETMSGIGLLAPEAR